jgi:hypothetical protein
MSPVLRIYPRNGGECKLISASCHEHAPSRGLAEGWELAWRRDCWRSKPDNFFGLQRADIE